MRRTLMVAGLVAAMAAPSLASARYNSASYSAPSSCTYENRRYYDERGQVIYAPVQVCR